MKHLFTGLSIEERRRQIFTMSGEELFNLRKYSYFIFYEQYKQNDKNELTDEVEIEKTTVYLNYIPATLIKIAYTENDWRFVKWEDSMGSDKIVEYIKSIKL